MPEPTGHEVGDGSANPDREAVRRLRRYVLDLCSELRHERQASAVLAEALAASQRDLMRAQVEARQRRDEAIRAAEAARARRSWFRRLRRHDDDVSGVP